MPSEPIKWVLGPPRPLSSNRRDWRGPAALPHWRTSREPVSRRRVSEQVRVHGELTSRCYKCVNSSRIHISACLRCRVVCRSFWRLFSKSSLNRISFPRRVGYTRVRATSSTVPTPRIRPQQSRSVVQHRAPKLRVVHPQRAQRVARSISLNRLSDGLRISPSTNLGSDPFRGMAPSVPRGEFEFSLVSLSSSLSRWSRLASDADGIHVGTPPQAGPGLRPSTSRNPRRLWTN